MWDSSDQLLAHFIITVVENLPELVWDFCLIQPGPQVLKPPRRCVLQEQRLKRLFDRKDLPILITIEVQPRPTKVMNRIEREWGLGGSGSFKRIVGGIRRSPFAKWKKYAYYSTSQTIRW